MFSTLVVMMLLVYAHMSKLIQVNILKVYNFLYHLYLNKTSKNDLKLNSNNNKTLRKQQKFLSLF